MVKITSDSIYFVDEEGTSPIKYSINKDTIIWYFDGIIQKSKYNIAVHFPLSPQIRGVNQQIMRFTPFSTPEKQTNTNQVSLSSYIRTH